MKLDNPSSDSPKLKTAEQAGPTVVDSVTNKTTDYNMGTDTDSTTEITTGPSEEHAHEESREAHVSELKIAPVHTKPQANVSIKQS